MKKIIFLLLVTSLSFSQNEFERIKIIEASNPQQVQALKDNYKSYFELQKILIAEFIKKNNLTDEQKFSLQRITDGIPFYYSVDNAGSVTTLRANSMYPGGSLGLSVTGQGITAGVWDGGKVRDTHQEFTGRVSYGDATSTLSDHSTHVTGTIIAQGVSPTRKGFAYQASAKTYDFANDINEMISFANQGFLVSNHSYGYIATNPPVSYFGSYDSQAVQVDNIMNTFPYYQVVKAAGNDRNSTTILQVAMEGGYDLLTGMSNSKNVLTVAAVGQVSTYTSPDSVVMSTFSNFGPTDDGRIKPDLSAKGLAVTSADSGGDNFYVVLQGTSMAAPAITGLIVLLQKHYNNLNPSTYMRSSTVRGLLCQSAREAGLDPGPDYGFGWGLPDGLSAANIITNKGISTILDERTLTNSQTYTTSFTINTQQNINVAIAWTDPVGVANISGDEDNRTPRLINNLDLKILKDGTTYYPWKLDPDLAASSATKIADNNVDNIERVEIFNAQPGTYTIQVNHKGTLQGGAQIYSLIASGSVGLALNSEDFVVDNNFFVYPNPVNNELHFSNPNNIEVANIVINDVSGKQVVSLNANGITNAIDVSNLQSGIYFIKFTTENKTLVKKFIKN